MITLKGLGDLNHLHGKVFLKYFLEDVYDKGMVVDECPITVTVDFGDKIKKFKKDDCLGVFSVEFGDHLTSIKNGEIVREFGNLESFPDDDSFLFDFDRFMK